ncbi:hypothetical protein EJB05_01757, partial [Eragrostis curvula]
YFNFLILSLRFYPGSGTVTSSAVPDSFAPRGGPSLWRRIDLTLPDDDADLCDGYLPCWLFDEDASMGWMEMARAAVRHSSGQCEAFCGRGNDDVLLYLADRFKYFNFLILSLRFYPGSGTVTSSAVPDSFAPRGGPSLWRRIDLTLPDDDADLCDGYLPCWLFDEDASMGWMEMARAAVRHSSGQCEAFCGRGNDDVLLYLAD